MSTPPITDIRQRIQAIIHKDRQLSIEGQLNLLEAIIQQATDEAVREARINENQRWADGYASALLDYPEFRAEDAKVLKAAKDDFEDRIRELRGE